VNQEQPKRSIDERIDAMADTMELIQAESLAVSRKIEALGKEIADLKAVVDTHEQEWNRFRRVMRAAFKEWMNGEDGAQS
jgi:hypothetical protein